MRVALLLAWPALAASLAYDSEAEAIAGLASRGVLEGGSDPCGALLSTPMASEALKRGWFLLAERMVVACTSVANDKLVGVLNEASGSIKASLQRIVQLASASNKALAPMEPAFQWAQSASSIFIQVKFAHKLDAPACIDLVDPQHFIQAERLGVSSGCKNSDKRFQLELDLFDAVNASASSWAVTSVGRGTFTLAKTAPLAKWSRLLRSTTRPKNMHIWFERQEQFDDELDALPAAAGLGKGRAPTADDQAAQPAVVEPVKNPDSLDAKIEADKLKVRKLADAKKLAVEQRVAKQKTETQRAADKKNAELDTKAGAFIATINDALRRDLAALDVLKKTHEKEPDAYVSPPAAALDALEAMTDDLLSFALPAPSSSSPERDDL